MVMRRACVLLEYRAQSSPFIDHSQDPAHFDGPIYTHTHLREVSTDFHILIKNIKKKSAIFTIVIKKKPL